MTPSVLFDCRWLAQGGAGRATELLLRGLAASPPEGRWLLWGPAAVEELAWAEAEVRVTSSDPRALAGQRSFLSVPRRDVAVYPHQLRPLRGGPSLTVIHDTIPLRFAATGRERWAKERFFRRVGQLSSLVATPSEYSKACIRRDLDVSGEKIVVLPYPFDDALRARVTAQRRSLPAAQGPSGPSERETEGPSGPSERETEVALFVGRFAAHKNIPRLISAFTRTDMARRGGRLVLIGGTTEEVADVAGPLGPETQAIVEARPSCPQAELERLLATCLLLVQPSLEEGFGLPAWEALCCGVPVCVSDGGALPEITHGLVEPFPARSIEAMAAAIDECAEQARARPEAIADRVERARQLAPSVAAYGQAFLAAMQRGWGDRL